jgi:DNA replication protein DnaC
MESGIDVQTISVLRQLPMNNRIISETLDFLPEARNLILAGANGLGKTMIAQNICHAAVLAGHSVLFRSAAALLEELHRQTPEGRQRKLRTYANVGLLCVDEVGYLPPRMAIRMAAATNVYGRRSASLTIRMGSPSCLLLAA